MCRIQTRRFAIGRRLRGLPFVIGLAGLAACTSLPPDQIEAIGEPYNEYIKEAYLELSERGPNKPRFYQKAIHAYEGEMVWPDPVASWNIRERVRPEAHRLRERLVTLLEAGRDEEVPARAAEAVASFDCWMEYEQRIAEGVVPPDPGCLAALVDALPELEAAVVDVPPAYLVYFQPGSTLLGINDFVTVEEAARMAVLAEANTVEVIGFADRSGSAAANQRLSEDRAEAVAQTLIEMGVPADRVRTTGAGEAATGDPVSGRRAEIRLQI